MWGRKGESEDELVQRRATKADSDGEGDSEELPRFSWSETFGLIIAAYQVLLPFLGAMVGAVLLVYLLFALFFR